MASKRSKTIPVADKSSTSSKPAVSEPALVSEILAVLLQSSRKELAHLLGGLLQSVSSEILEQVRAEALKIGAAKVVSAPFQTCSHTQLNAVFSFLEHRDLRASEIVCRRWRTACRDSNAGWIALLGQQQTAGADFFRTLAARHLSFAHVWRSPRLHLPHIPFGAQPYDLTKITQSPVITAISLEFGFSSKQLDPLASMTQLKSLYFPGDNLAELKCLPQLTSLSTTRQLTVGEIAVLAKSTKLQTLSCLAPNAFVNLPDNAFSRLKELSFHFGDPTAADLNAFSRFPSLQTLEIHPWRQSKPILAQYQALSTITQLTSLTIAVSSDNETRALASLTRLTNLVVFDSDSKMDGEFLQSLTNLRELGYEGKLRFVTASNLLRLPQLRSLRLDESPVTEVWYLLAKLPIEKLGNFADLKQFSVVIASMNKTLKELLCRNTEEVKAWLVLYERPDVVVTPSPW